MIADADGSGEIELASHRLPDYFDYPAWSRDGEVIACTLVDYSGDRQRVNVVEVRVRDGRERAIGSQSWRFAYKPQWLSDGRGLVLSALVGSSTQIFFLSYPDGEASRITNDLNTYIGVSLTADSRALVTVEQKLLSGLWVTSIGDVRRAGQITFAADTHGAPHWAPDGKIVYSANTNGNWDIWEIEADGTGRKQLTFDTYIDQHPSATPDGRYTVFASTRGGASDIWRIDRDGANLKQLTFGGGNLNPLCTPDGEWVIYTSITGSPYTNHKVPIDGGEAIQLTDTPCRRPAISPDGRLLACYYVEWRLSTQIESRSIAVINLDGEAAIKFYDIPVTVDQGGGIQWTPDGQSISYIDNRDGSSNIWSRPLSGGPAKRVTDFRGDRMFAFDWSRDGSQLVCLRGIFKQDVVMMSDFRPSGRRVPALLTAAP